MCARARSPPTVSTTWPRTSAQSHALASEWMSTVTRGSRRRLRARCRTGSVFTSTWSPSWSTQVSSACGWPSGMRVTTVARFLPLASRAASSSSAMLVLLRSRYAEASARHSPSRPARPRHWISRSPDKTVHRVRADPDIGQRQPGPLRRPDVPHRLLARGGIHPVDEQHPVQMIGLMLQAPGKLPVPGHLNGPAVAVEPRRHRVTPPLNVVVHPRARQAALRPVLLRLVRELQHRVDQVPADPVHVEDEHPQPHPDLRRRQPRALLVAQRLGEVLDQPPDLPVK